MKSARKHLSRAVPLTAVLLLFLCIVSGCALVGEPPELPPDNTPSYDGNDRNSGILSTHPGGFLVTPRFIARYDAMVGRYGERFQPALKKGDGVTPEPPNFVIDAEHMVKFLEMNNWRRSTP